MTENFEKSYLIGIAAFAHAVNGLACFALNDGMTLPPWEETTDAHKNSIMNKVAAVLSNPNPTPDGNHQNWMKVKQAEGWVYGPEKNEESKQHPCMVPYDQLPENQKVKDSLFIGVVKSLRLANPEAIKNFGDFANEITSNSAPATAATEPGAPAAPATEPPPAAPANGISEAPESSTTPSTNNLGVVEKEEAAPFSKKTSDKEGQKLEETNKNEDILEAPTKESEPITPAANAPAPEPAANAPELAPAAQQPDNKKPSSKSKNNAGK